MSHGFAASDGPLIDGYDALLVDLDGVVYLDDQALPDAADALRAARPGRQVCFVTNNAARTPTAVAERLQSVGVEARPQDVLTSAVATAELLAADLPAGAPVLVVGGEGLRAAVEAVGLAVVATAAERPVAVAQGWGPHVGWADLAEAMVALRAGARWVVTNRDLTLPSPRGPLPGSGALVAALVAATGREPAVVVGKPQPTLFTTARDRLAATAPLVLGDRLDTDIAGARAAAIPSLLVLTGVSRPRDLLAAPPAARPDYLGATLAALRHPHPAVELHDGFATCGAVHVTAAGDVERPSAGAGGDLELRLDGLRAAATLAWDGQLGPERHDLVLHALDLD